MTFYLEKMCSQKKENDKDAGDGDKEEKRLCMSVHDIIFRVNMKLKYTALSISF